MRIIIMFFKEFFAFIFIMTIISNSVLFSTTVTKDFRKTVDFQSDGKISVKTLNGKIETASWNKKSVYIEAEIKVKARNRREAEKFLDKVEIMVHKNGDRLRIEADYPKRKDDSSFWDWAFGKKITPTVNFTIKVPKETNLKLKSTNGHIAVEDIIGECYLTTTNGGIEAEEMNGTLDARTTNGSVTANIKDFNRNDEISLKTTNGSIKLFMPSNTKADIEASTVNGSLRTEFPLSVRGRISKKHLSGEINGGGGLIDLSTINGSITILEW